MPNHNNLPPYHQPHNNPYHELDLDLIEEYGGLAQAPEEDFSKRNFLTPEKIAVCGRIFRDLGLMDDFRPITQQIKTPNTHLTHIEPNSTCWFIEDTINRTWFTKDGNWTSVPTLAMKFDTEQIAYDSALLRLPENTKIRWQPTEHIFVNPILR